MAEGSLQERVQRAWDNAAENGYDFAGWTDVKIAFDMVEADADLEHENLDDVKRCVRRIREGT